MASAPGDVASRTCIRSICRACFRSTARGRKHKRRIRLEPWQTAILREAPWGFIRGCIRSDGCCFVNRTGRYEYLSYDFGNKSGDIARLFVSTCRAVGIRCRMNYSPKRDFWDIRINRRADVEAMRKHVGVKR